MAEYEIRISGVHYAANGDSVAGQKDTEEMHMRTRELLSRIDRVRPIVTLSPDPENHVHERALQARALGKRIGRVALECVDLVWDLLRASRMPMLLAKVKEVAVRNHGYAVVTVSAEALQQTQPTVASETEWGPWLSDLPLLPPSEQLWTRWLRNGGSSGKGVLTCSVYGSCGGLRTTTSCGQACGL